MKNMTDIELRNALGRAKQDVESIEKEIENRKNADIASRNKLISDSPAGKFAIALHSKECIHNHTDGCGWFYEFTNKEHEWNSYTHKSYLEKANKILKRLDNGIKVDANNFFEVLDILKGR